MPSARIRTERLWRAVAGPARRGRWALALLMMPALFVPPAPGLAQTAGDTQALNAALTRLAQNPLDAGALIEAGSAALAMGDAEAAIGFFSRANQVAPSNGRAKAGLASAYVHNEDPFTAIRLFAEAEQAGPLYADAVVDRGLAYDLVGDNVTAQRLYRLAGPRYDEALRRLSLSLAISGDKRGSEAALAPLLARQDKSAWRVRAFALAILGETAQAESIANATLPAGLSAAISPYLRYMGQLTPAQQAAAANLGHFPRASEIGRDDPRIAAYARPAARPSAKGPGAGLIPAGEPLGKRTTQRQTRDERERQSTRRRDRDRDRQASRERVRPPEPVVATTSSPAPVPAASAPAAAVARPAASPVTAPAGSALAATQAAQASAPAAAAPPLALAEPRREVAPTRPVQGPSFELLASGADKTPETATAPPPAQSSAPASPPAAAPAAAAAIGPPAPANLADAFAEFNRPTISTAPAPGAVDVRRIAPTRAAPKETKPAPPAQPSRIWVQVATGRDRKALAFDWRKMSRQNPAIFKSRKPYVTAWNQTNRLLTGPFESEAKASEFMNLLRKEEVAGAFLWTSPAGQVVDELGGVK
jgi:tetratricopeptide (TPR) repeat protein